MDPAVSQTPMGAGGLQAVILQPVRGCRKEIRQDQRPTSPNASTAPYFRSPASVKPLAENCARIWCVLPVCSRIRTRLRSPAIPTRSYSRRAVCVSLPARGATMVLCLALSRNSSSSITPFSGQTPWHRARYSFSNAPLRICADRSEAARAVSARRIRPPTTRSRRCTVRRFACGSPSACRASSGKPPGSSVERTPTGLMQTITRSSR